MNIWYESLQKSSLTPPNYIFSAVWTVLYILITISLIIYLKSNYTKSGLILFILQLILNLIWPRLFFSKRLICGSLLNIILMNIFVFLTYNEFKKSSLIAANLLIPYMIWILFAFYLNLFICVNN
jgi:benzodiazapine receptor